MRPTFRNLIAKLVVNRKFYASKYPDVAESGLDLVDHFERYGFDVPIRSPNQTAEFVLLKGISALLVFLSLRNIHRPDLENIYLLRAREAYQSKGQIIPIYYYFITIIVLYLHRRVSGKGNIENGRQIDRENTHEQSIVRYENWLKDFRIYDPSRLSGIEKVRKFLGPIRILAYSYAPGPSVPRAEILLRNIEPLARRNYVNCNRFRYWACHNAAKRLLAKINANKAPALKLQLQVARHISLESLRSFGDVECLVSEFECRTPVGQAEIFGKPHRGRVKQLARKSIIIPRLKDAKIFSKSNMVLLNFGAINDTGAHRRHAPYILHSSDPLVIGKTSTEFLININTRCFEQIERGVMLCGVASNAWGHWFSDFVTRLEFCERIQDFKSFPIIVDEDMPKSHYDLLRLVSSNDIVLLPNYTSFEVRDLIYAPPLTFFPVHLFPNRLPPNVVNPVNPQSYQFLKDRIEAKLPPADRPNRRIFLSRRSSSWRRLANDEEVAAYLSKLGYETIQLEQHSLEEQIRIFQSASHVVAANGSSLQGIIFCKTDVKILILAQRSLNNWGAYNAQVGALGYKMKFLCGELIDEKSGKHADYYIPLKLLVAAMNVFDA